MELWRIAAALLLAATCSAGHCAAAALPRPTGAHHGASDAVSSGYYTAAVVEHAPTFLDPNAAPPTRSEALAAMRNNLEALAPHLAVAAQQGAQIVVLPEDALTGFLNCKRAQMAPYLEVVPDPDAGLVVPCNNASWAASPVLQDLSCAAVTHGVVLVADVGAMEPCAGQPGCPADGQWQFNTQVALDESGAVIGRFHKYHLFYEPQYNAPALPEVRTFNTSFGVRFGQMVCFGIMFADPSEDLRRAGVRDVVFSSWWVNTPPTVFATQWYQAWTRHYGTTLLAAGGVMAPAVDYSGSGIFSSGAVLAAYYDVATSTAPQDRVLVARVPVADTAQPRSRPAAATARPALRPAGSPGLAKTPRAKPELLQRLRGGLHCNTSASMLEGRPQLPLPHAQVPLPRSASPAPQVLPGQWGVKMFSATPGLSGSVSASSGLLACTVDFEVSAEAATEGVTPPTYAVLAFEGSFEGMYDEHFCALAVCESAEWCGQTSVGAPSAFAQFSVSQSASSTDGYTPFVLLAGDQGSLLPPEDAVFTPVNAASEANVLQSPVGRALDSKLLSAGVLSLRLVPLLPP